MGYRPDNSAPQVDNAALIKSSSVYTSLRSRASKIAFLPQRTHICKSAVLQRINITDYKLQIKSPVGLLQLFIYFWQHSIYN